MKRVPQEIMILVFGFAILFGLVYALRLIAPPNPPLSIEEEMRRQMDSERETVRVRKTPGYDPHAQIPGGTRTKPIAKEESESHIILGDMEIRVRPSYRRKHQEGAPLSTTSTDDENSLSQP